MYQCPMCGKVMRLSEWKRRRLHAGSLQCPKCMSKLHDRELRKVGD